MRKFLLFVLLLCSFTMADGISADSRADAAVSIAANGASVDAPVVVAADAPDAPDLIDAMETGCIQRCVNGGSARDQCQRQCEGALADARIARVQDIREDVRDLGEDVRDRREDVRDQREDIVDTSNVDLRNCLMRCGNDSLCTTRCRAADTREDVRDAREDIRDVREDIRDSVENTLDRLNLPDEAKARIRVSYGACVQSCNSESCKSSCVEKARVMVQQELRSKVTAEAVMTSEQKEKLAALGAGNMQKRLNPEQAQRIASLDQEQIKKLALLSRERQKKLLQLTPENIRTELAGMETVTASKDKLFRSRVVAESSLRSINERITQTTEKIKQLKDDYMEKRQAFQLARQKLADCQDAASDECISLREEARAQAKEYLVNVAEQGISNLDALLSKVKASEDLTEDGSMQIQAQIDEKIHALEVAIEHTTAAETPVALQQAAREIDSIIKDIKIRAQKETLRLYGAKVKHLIIRAEVEEKKLEKILARMEQDGIDPSAYEKQLEEFSKLVEDARSSFDAAQEAFRTDDYANTRVLVAEGHDALRSANKVLVQLWKDIRASVKDTRVVEEVEIETDFEIVGEADDGFEVEARAQPEDNNSTQQDTTQDSLQDTGEQR